MNVSAEETKESVFTLRDCALTTMATGCKAQNLREFKNCLEQVPAASIYHHFWGRLLRAQFDEPEYNNDFASWVYHALHDKPLAERLSMVSPTDFADTESLRQEMIDLIEEDLDRKEIIRWAYADQQFHFLKAQLVVFDTGLRFTRPHELVPHLNHLSTGSIYYHFIDARSRTPDRCDDFSTWLQGFNDEYQVLVAKLRGLDPYFSSLKEIRQMVTQIFHGHIDMEMA